jgi:hypothetical protein
MRGFSVRQPSYNSLGYRKVFDFLLKEKVGDFQLLFERISGNW